MTDQDERAASPEVLKRLVHNLQSCDDVGLRHMLHQRIAEVCRELQTCYSEQLPRIWIDPMGCRWRLSWAGPQMVDLKRPDTLGPRIERRVRMGDFQLAYAPDPSEPWEPPPVQVPAVPTEEMVKRAATEITVEPDAVVVYEDWSQDMAGAEES